MTTIAHNSLFRGLFLSSTLTLTVTGAAFATPDPLATRGPAPHPTKAALSQTLGISELKLQMAESTFKLRPSTKTLSDLVASLEDVMNTQCLAHLPRTLAHKGSPTDPTCVGLMGRLLELHPDNPVALCLRDGIDASSCVTAYAKQDTAAYDSYSHRDLIADPALRVGLSRPEQDKIQQISEALLALNAKYQSTNNPVEKLQYMDEAADMYDQALATACRITTVALVISKATFDPAADSEINDIRQKLLSLPPSVREDHQGRMLLGAEEKLKTMKPGSPEWNRQQEVIRTIKQPDVPMLPSPSTLQRTRFVLPVCAQLIQQATAAAPGFPAPICHKEGWYSPQCVAALKNWKTIKATRKAAALGTPNASQKPPSIISTF